MKIKHFNVGPIETNCYLVINEETKELFVIDPGGGFEKICRFIDQGGFKPVAILYTHGHFDHVSDGAALHEKYSVPRIIGEKDTATIEDPDSNVSFMMGHGAVYGYDKTCRDGEELVLAGMTVSVIETPGHTPGGVCFYLEKEGVLFSGDTLFFESVGRTDFPGGSARELADSIKKRLYVLPDLTVVYTGHGEPTKIGYEKHNNYFAGNF